MSNLLNTNGIWVLDTAGAGALSTDQLRVKGFRWVSNTASAGDQVVIKDQVGNVVWESRAVAANYVESDIMYGRPGLNLNGLALTTLASGKLYVEFL